jgi:hypothetical protein
VNTDHGASSPRPGTAAEPERAAEATPRRNEVGPSTNSGHHTAAHPALSTDGTVLYTNKSVP